MKMSEVRGRMIDPSPNTTRLMDRLLEKGAVERERCSEDRRVVYVRLSEAGSQLLDKMNQAMDSLFKSVDGGLSKTEAETINSLIEKFRGSVDENTELAHSL